MTQHWYVLSTKVHCEDAASRHAESLGITVFYPSLRVRTVNPRARKVRPYFPGYVFVQADLAILGLSVFRWMPHANGLVCFGGEPADVSEQLIAGIRRTIDQLAGEARAWYDELALGDVVKIHAGPFAGYSAIFDARASGSERVRVLLQLLSGQSVTLTIDAAQLEPAMGF
jgi:transcription antitermination factor NusG